MSTWTCIVWVPQGLNARALDEFDDGVAADLPAGASITVQAIGSEFEYRLELDGDGEDKLRVRVGRLSQVEQVAIRCEFGGQSGTIREL